MNISQMIIDSHDYCKQIGMNPTEVPSPQNILTPDELEKMREDYDEILSVVSFFSDKVLQYLKGYPILLSVSNQDGYIVQMTGDETIRQTVNDLGIRPGVQFTENSMGTNVVNFSLKYNKTPIQLIGQDHFHEYLHGTACYAVAFHYTDINNLLGSLIIMTGIQFQNPMLITLLAITVDSIERELLLRKQNHQLNILNQIITDNTRNGIILTDSEGIVIRFNQYAELFTGITMESMEGKSIDQLPIMGPYIKEVLYKGETFEDVQLTFTKENDSNSLVCLFDTYPLRDEKNKLLGAFGQFRSITERVRAEEKYNYLANHDDLTKLPNRRYFKDKVREHLEIAELNNKKLAMCYIDLNRFKVINDTMGHSSGDMLLQYVARQFEQMLLPGEFVARMGGDEFMFIISDFEYEEEVVNRIDAILDLFKGFFNIKGYDFHVSASIGISIYPKDGDTYDSLMTAADTAMYSAKSKGFNRYEFYRTDMNIATKDQVILEGDLRKAIEHGELFLVYQPQVDISSGCLNGVEALVRWNHSTKGLISPNDFIPLAEETGLIRQIDRWVLYTACMQNKKWQMEGLPPFRVSVNLSSQEFLDDKLEGLVKQVLQDTGLEPQYLDLEITETMTMDVAHAIPLLHKLNEIGVQISMDDFGMGYSSLNYLKNFSINRLKIDRSFVKDIDSDSKSNGMNIVSMIIAMAHSMNLEVVAEGVETKEQLRFLQVQKCNEVQGYYFSPPIEACLFKDKFIELTEQMKKLY